jgi:hypothetical protein
VGSTRRPSDSLGNAARSSLALGMVDGPQAQCGGVLCTGGGPLVVWEWGTRGVGLWVFFFFFFLLRVRLVYGGREATTELRGLITCLGLGEWRIHRLACCLLYGLTE